MSMISARIERLPFARFHTHLLLMGGLGYMFDAMDAAVLAFILPVLRTAWNLSSVEIGVLAVDGWAERLLRRHGRSFLLWVICLHGPFPRRIDQAVVDHGAKRPTRGLRWSIITDAAPQAAVAGVNQRKSDGGEAFRSRVTAIGRRVSEGQMTPRRRLGRPRIFSAC